MRFCITVSTLSFVPSRSGVLSLMSVISNRFSQEKMVDVNIHEKL